MTDARDRFNDPDFTSVVCDGTFKPITQRIQAMLAHERRMVLIERDINTDGADILKIETGLHLDTAWGEPIEFSAHEYGRSMTLHLTPGIHRIAISAPKGSTEKDMRMRYAQRGEIRHQPVTYVRLDGSPTTPGRNDFIEIEKWNDHGVGTLATIAFQSGWG